ncbi:MAG: imidazolonepropionase [Myxococcales bacterium]|nr:imidazolonepropionase [Myxococcales bacterium]MCB9668525.1 imidazolonepropionase [Alphaproteobacteria bacterium]MCB9690766.1 imidazolonepropionase [Alphaproteobacteria bacterium]
MQRVITGIDVLLTLDPENGEGPLGELRDAAVLLEDDRVLWIGASAQAPPADERVDAAGCLVMPALVDMHTHAIWAGSRAGEFQQRLAGADYTAILEAGGGILSTVRHTRAAGDEALIAGCTARLARMRARGVGAVEVKSGYGLSPEHEARLLRCAREAGHRAGVRVLTTFLGAHAVPAEWRPDREGYVQHVIEEQLPLAAPHADFVDVYVDRGAFTVEEGERILRAGQAIGLRARLHAEQVERTGAAAMGARIGALSADHLERLDADGIDALARAGTIAGLLPGAMLYLRDAAPPVAAFREAGVRMAVATDCNPGSSPVDDLWTAGTLAAVTMRLTVEEVLLGMTRHAADALGLADRGRIAVGSTGPLLVVEPPPAEPPSAAALVQHLGAPRLRAIVQHPG